VLKAFSGCALRDPFCSQATIERHSTGTRQSARAVSAWYRRGTAEISRGRRGGTRGYRGGTEGVPRMYWVLDGVLRRACVRAHVRVRAMRVCSFVCLCSFFACALGACARVCACMRACVSCVSCVSARACVCAFPSDCIFAHVCEASVCVCVCVASVCMRPTAVRVLTSHGGDLRY
jgi:hypothetical protein